MNLFLSGSPLPSWLMCLWVTLPGIWLGATALCDRLAADVGVRRVLQPAVALGSWILAVELASLAVDSFWRGLPLGMAVLSVAGMVFWWRSRRTAAKRSSLIEQSDLPFSRGMWLGMVLTTIPIAAIACRGYIPDDLIPSCHLSNVAQLQNNYFPPRFPGYPGVPLRFHYGFDLVSAGLTALTRLNAHSVFAVATIFGWAYSWCLLWVLGQRLTGTSRGGFWTAMATLFGGGAAVFFAPLLSHVPLIDRLMGRETFGIGRAVNTPLADYIFQRPFTLGLPLGVAVLLMALSPPADSSARHSIARHAVLGLLLAALSLTQVTLFVTLSATVAFTEALIERRPRFLLALGAAWAIAWLMGGLLFTRIPDSPAGFYFRFWPTEVPATSSQSAAHWALRVLAWYLATIGAQLPIGLWGLRYVRQPLRVALLLLALGGLSVPIFIGYRFTDAIVKFLTIASLALGILSGASLAWLAGRPTFGRRAALAICLTLLTASSVTDLGTLIWLKYVPHGEGPLQAGPIPQSYMLEPVPLDSDDLRTVAWLRIHAKSNDVVYRLPTLALGYIQWGGLSSTPETVKLSLAFGVTPERIAARDRLIADRPPELAPYRAAGINWFVVGPDDPTMLEHVHHWEQAGKVHREATFGNLEVFRTSDR